MSVKRTAWQHSTPVFAGNGRILYTLTFRLVYDPPNIFRPASGKVRSVSKIRFSPFEVRE